MKSVIVTLLENDADLMQTIITSVSEAIICNIWEHSAFTTKLTESVIDSFCMDNMRQQVYESCKMDLDKSAKTTAALHAQINRSNQSLTEELNKLEQYSRRNCLAFHGLRENSADVDNTTEAIMKVCKGSLGMQIDSGCIDRSHSMGEIHFLRAAQSYLHC